MRLPNSAASFDAAQKSPTHGPMHASEFGDVSDMGEDFVEVDGADGAVQAVSEVADRTLPMSAAETETPEQHEVSGRVRERRATLVSPIPALLAASMTTLLEVEGPAVPTSLPSKSAKGHTVGSDAASGATGYDRVVELVGAARRALEGRDFYSAACLAEDALAAGESVGTPEATSLLGDSQPLFERVFASFVGPLGATATLVVSWEQILTHRLGDSTRSFLRRVDGVRTLEQTLGHSSIPPQHALRIAASALRAGFIRVG